MKIKSFSLFAFFVLILSACSTSAPGRITDISPIIGTWKSEPPGLAIKVLPDGTVLADVTSRKIEEGAQWEYTFWFEEGDLLMDGYLGCHDEIGYYDVEILSNGNLDFTALDDECFTRVATFMGQQVEPVKDVQWLKVE